jgi:hypothetical protein
VGITLCLLFAAGPHVAFAIKPCRFIGQEQFVSQLLQQSDLVIYGTISGYSGCSGHALDPDGGCKLWTEIGVVRPLYDKGNSVGSGETVRVYGWQSWWESRGSFGPTYKPGDYVVLWLKGGPDRYQLANPDSSNVCNARTYWKADAQERTRPFWPISVQRWKFLRIWKSLGLNFSGAGSQKWIPIDRLSQFIEEVRWLISMFGGSFFIGERKHNEPWNGALFDTHGRFIATYSEGVRKKK